MRIGVLGKKDQLTVLLRFCYKHLKNNIDTKIMYRKCYTWIRSIQINEKAFSIYLSHLSMYKIYHPGIATKVMG